MTSKTRSDIRPFGFAGALTVALIVLKLCHVITWSWWLVTVLVWAPAVLVVAFLAVLLVVAVVATARGRQ